MTATAPQPLSATTRETLARVGAATIANALLKRGLRNTMLLGMQPLSPDQPALVGQASLIGRQGFEPVGLRTEASEDRLRPFRQLPGDLHDPLAEGDPAPLGEVARRIGLGIVARHILGAFTR